MFKNILKLILLSIAFSTCFAGSSFAETPCEMIGRNAVLFAQWRNAGQTREIVDKYLDGMDQGTQKLLGIMADAMWSEPVGTLPPGQWQILFVEKCHDQLGYDQ